MYCLALCGVIIIIIQQIGGGGEMFGRRLIIGTHNHVVPINYYCVIVSFHIISTAKENVFYMEYYYALVLHT